MAVPVYMAGLTMGHSVRVGGVVVAAEDLSIKALLQGIMTAGSTTVLQGVVKSASPLKIQMVNDEKLVINSNNTFVPRHLTDYETEVTVDWRTEAESGGGGWAEFASHSHAIKGKKKIIVHF